MKKTSLLLNLCFLFFTSPFKAQASACFVCGTSNFEAPEQAKDDIKLLTLKSKIVPKGCTNNHCFHLDCLTDHIIGQKRMKCPVKNCDCSITLSMRKYPRTKTKNSSPILEWVKGYGMTLEWKDEETQETFYINRLEDNPSEVCVLKGSAIKQDDSTVPLLPLPRALRMITASELNALDTLSAGLQVYREKYKEQEEHAVSTFASLAENAHPKNEKMLHALNLFKNHLKEMEHSASKDQKELSYDIQKKAIRLTKMGRYGTDKHGKPLCPKGETGTLYEGNEPVYFIYH